MALSLSVDHRAIDGAAGAKFMATLKGLIEAPEGLFG
jgi:pyruvate dehydrogenase E2 component (dihydrolipoamide acetyltransferase)